MVEIPTRKLSIGPAFIQRVLGFQDFYGCNINAWIDRMTSVDAPEGGMLRVSETLEFQKRCPEHFDALLESFAVDWRVGSRFG